jgi:hypothetical protein
MNAAAVYAAPQPVDGQPGLSAPAGRSADHDAAPARLTARTAALLQDVLRHLGERGRRRVTDLGGRAVSEADDDLFTALPGFTWTQPEEWRRRFVAAFDVLAERLARGEIPRPANAAEEFALVLAIVQAELLVTAQPELVERVVDGVAGETGDFDWRQCHESLFRHGYVPLLFQAEFAGLEDPGNQVNQYLDIGDYRPYNWFRPFD